MSDAFVPGDKVLMRDKRGSFLVEMTSGTVRLGGSRGSISASVFDGKRPGDTISVGSREFRLIRPDIMDVLEHIERGPQIISPKDSAAIVMGLGLRSGSRVLEAGAGSGGLTLALLNAVQPEGIVLTFDVREDHLGRTRSNVERSGMSACWEGRIGDVRVPIEQGPFDAVALDIPDPENALGSVRKNLRPGGRICCYVPTMNQVERCFLVMTDSGYSDIRALEILQRDMSVKEGATRPSTEMLGHTGYLVFGRALS